MNHLFGKCSHIFLLIAVLGNSLSACKSQTDFGANLLQLEKTISLPDVKGRLDHLDINLADQVVYLAALGNNTVEVIDLRNGKVIHRISGLDEPQGVCYIPGQQEIMVANGGNGDCYFYNARSFEKVATVHLSSDADDVRYYPEEGKVYVGYGSGGIAIIDASTHKQIGDIKLPGHPESFQIDRKLNRLFVNVPDAKMVGVINLSQMKLEEKWTRYSPVANFPMAVDTVLHHLFIGYRHPSKLVVLDALTGKDISINSMTGDADDLYYDHVSSNVYVSGGDGAISIFQQQSSNGFKQVANISTSSGARTSLWVPELNLFILAARASSGEPAKLLIYKNLK